METKDLARDKIILIDNELPTTHLIQQFVKSERPHGCKILCWIKNMLYIAAFILIIFFISSMMSDIRVSYRDDPVIFDHQGEEILINDQIQSDYDYPVTEQSVIEQKVAELEGQVSLVKKF